MSNTLILCGVIGFRYKKDPRDSIGASPLQNDNGDDY